MKPFAGKRVTVAGLGSHGGAIGNIRWLCQAGAEVTVTDLKPAEALRESIAELQDLPDIRWVLGRHRQSDFTEADMVVRNPAMPRRSPYIEAAREAKVPVEMDSSLFFKFCPTKNIIGVTGTKGKTTATLAISHLMKLVYPHVATIGVESTSPLAALPGLSARDVVVFELSSWRIEGLREHSLSPHTAVITSLYPDHLNTYDSFADYVETKKSLVASQSRRDRVILNYDDPLLRQWSPTLLGSVSWFSVQTRIPGNGIYIDQKGTVTVSHRAYNSAGIKLFSIKRIPWPSRHQQRNILPAIYLAFCNQVRVEAIEQHLATMTKPAHRLEHVRDIQGVSYINDSASTIPEAMAAALEASADKHIVLIAGGSDKKLKFERLARQLPNYRIRAAIFLPGDATPHLLREIRGAWESPPPLIEAGNMDEAVRRATQYALPGDVVLLSPGATSFGLFKHEFDRGEQFRKAVEALY